MCSWCRLDYEVAELTWENGQLAMHGLGQPRVLEKPVASAVVSKYPWDKPRAGGTLESIVNQATGLPHLKSLPDGINEDLVPWFDHDRAVAATAAAASVTMTMDALVPCSNNNNEAAATHHPKHVMESVPSAPVTCVGGSSTRVGSCSGGAINPNDAFLPRKRESVARATSTQDWSSRDQSITGSATFERGSPHVTFETCDLGSPENTSSDRPCTKTITVDDHDSVCHSRPQANLLSPISLKARFSYGSYHFNSIFQYFFAFIIHINLFFNKKKCNFDIPTFFSIIIVSIILKRRTEDEEDKKRGPGKSSVSTKRSRAAAIHNQSERVCSPPPHTPYLYLCPSLKIYIFYICRKGEIGSIRE